jgi:metallo-beta-lactamase class B
MRTFSTFVAAILGGGLAACAGGDADADSAEASAPADRAAQVAQHMATAQSASTDFPQLYDRVCTQAADAAPRAAADATAGEGRRAAAATPQPGAAPTNPTTPPAAGRGGQGAPQGPPPRSEWYAEPRKVFDNLYFVGQTEYSAWAVVTSDGIIVIDPIYDWSVEAEVVEGLQKLGFDPRDIKYVLVSHAHRDHVGGARLLQERYGARVVMGAGDWDLLERSSGSWPKPVRDVVAEDGQELTLGDTTLRLYLTPGHTPGTLSTIFRVMDGGTAHTAAIWGGTAYNFLGDPDEAIWFQRYIDSARRFKQLTRDANADVIISNHSNFDESDTKLAALAERAPGTPHPYVVGNESIQRYLTVVEECAQVGLLNVTGDNR